MTTRLALLGFLGCCIMITGTQAATVNVTATVTADNHYALFVGSPTGVTLIGTNELGPSGLGGFNWSAAETFGFGMEPGEYLYLAGWSDNRVAQGWIGQFVFATGETIFSNTGWEVLLSNQDLDDNASPPPPSAIQGSAGAAGWVPVTGSVAHGSEPWGMIAGVSSEANWIWGGPLLEGSNFGEYQIFRFQTLVSHLQTPVETPEPGTFLLFTAALALVAWWGGAGTRKAATKRKVALQTCL